MAVTREQVVKWLTDSGISFFHNCKGDVIGEFDEAVKLITLARDDLEATIAEQAETLRVIRNEYDFKCQQLAEQAKEIERLQGFYDKEVTRSTQLRQQLQASLAREAQMREALNHIATSPKLQGSAWADFAKMSIALPSDDTALREYGAKLITAERTKIADYLDTLYVTENAADNIRKGTFK